MDQRDPRRTLLFVAAGMVLAGAIVLLPSAFAVDDLGLFQLDGNAVDAPGDPAGADWEALFNGGGNPVAFTGIVPDDPEPTDTTIFTGGRKDIQDIPDWGITSGTSPDKAEITNAYASAYTSASGDLILYFGADRISNNGDTFLGFWFFKQKIGINGSFTGAHSEGDTLVLVNFPQASGADPEISVVQWDESCGKGVKNPVPGASAPSGCAAKNLLLKLQGSGTNGAVCAAGDGVNPVACAVANDENGPNDPTPAPWPYEFKDGSTGSFPYETFFEGGINITELTGGPACFSSFMAESRSSSSFTAALKDFVLGDFDVCAIDVSKSCDVTRLTHSGDDTDKLFAVSFEGQVTNSGGGTFGAGETATIVDDAGTPGCESGTESACDDDVTMEVVLQENLMPGDSVPFSGTFYSDENPPVNTVAAQMSFGTDTNTADPYTTPCTGLQLNPALSISKACTTSLESNGGLLAVKVNWTGQVCNTGDVPLSVTVDNDQPSDPTQVFSGDLTVPADPANPTAEEGACADLGGSYFPGQANGGATAPASATFSDTLSATGSNAALASDVGAMATGHCPLCPGDTCP